MTSSRLHLHPAVFLDRDGTICVEKNYLSRPEELELLPGAAEAIRLANRHHLKVVVVSNQSGVARGFFDEATVERRNRRLQELLQARHARIDGIYYCPHHLDGKPPYNIACTCRKPQPGLLLKAARELNLDITRSVVIGDKASDIQTAANLHIPGILVLTGYGASELENLRTQGDLLPQYVAENVLSALQWWIHRKQKAR